MLKVSLQESGRAVAVRCSGRIVRGEEAVLERAVQSAVNARIILLDLAEVVSVDAGGLAALVWSHKWAQKHGARLQLVNPSPFVDEILVRTGLDEVFDISRFDQALHVLRGDCCRAAEMAAGGF